MHIRLADLVGELITCGERNVINCRPNFEPRGREFESPRGVPSNQSVTSNRKTSQRPCRRPVGVGCELKFKPLLAADTNRGSALPSDSRPGEGTYDP